MKVWALALSVCPLNCLFHFQAGMALFGCMLLIFNQPVFISIGIFTACNQGEPPLFESGLFLRGPDHPETIFPVLGHTEPIHVVPFLFRSTTIAVDLTMNATIWGGSGWLSSGTQHGFWVVWPIKLILRGRAHAVISRAIIAGNIAMKSSLRTKAFSVW